MFELVDVKIEKSNFKILTNINLKLPQRGLVWIEGASGSGKSSLLRVLCALDSPSSGQIYFAGKPISQLSIAQLRSECIYVPQMPSLGDLSVMECIKLPFSFKVNQQKKFNEHKLRALVKYLNLENELSKNTQDLSGGEKLRFALVRAILLKPRCLLLDEPTSALDVHMEQKVLKLLKALSNDILIVTSFHTNSIEAYCTNKIIIEDKHAYFS